MKTTIIRLLLAGTLAAAPAIAFAEGNTTPGDHTPVVHDRTPSAHDHGATAPHK